MDKPKKEDKKCSREFKEMIMCIKKTILNEACKKKLLAWDKCKKF